MTAPQSTPPRADAALTLASTRTLRITAIAGFVGVLIALGGIAYVAMPLQTPLQDCGTAATFLVDGRVNAFGDPANPPPGATSEDVQANNAQPCQERAANRALPGAVVILAGTLIALGALVVEFFARLRLSRRARTTPATAQVAGVGPADDVHSGAGSATDPVAPGA